MDAMSFVFGMVTAIAVETILIIAFCIWAYNENNKRK